MSVHGDSAYGLIVSCDGIACTAVTMIDLPEWEKGWTFSLVNDGDGLDFCEEHSRTNP